MTAFSNGLRGTGRLVALLAVIARGVSQPGPMAMADGAIADQGTRPSASSAGVSGPLPSQGLAIELLRPA